MPSSIGGETNFKQGKGHSKIQITTFWHFMDKVITKSTCPYTDTHKKLLKSTVFNRLDGEKKKYFDF